MSIYTGRDVLLGAIVATLGLAGCGPSGDLVSTGNEPPVSPGTALGAANPYSTKAAVLGDGIVITAQSDQGTTLASCNARAIYEPIRSDELRKTPPYGIRLAESGSTALLVAACRQSTEGGCGGQVAFKVFTVNESSASEKMSFTSKVLDEFPTSQIRFDVVSEDSTEAVVMIGGLGGKSSLDLTLPRRARQARCRCQASTGLSTSMKRAMSWSPWMHRYPLLNPDWLKAK